jgi:hypothetical protein
VWPADRNTRCRIPSQNLVCEQTQTRPLFSSDRVPLSADEVPLRSSTQVSAYATDANIETPIAAATVKRNKVFRRILLSPRNGFPSSFRFLLIAPTHAVILITIQKVLTRVSVTAETLLDCFGPSLATSSAWVARNTARPNSAIRGAP